MKCFWSICLVTVAIFFSTAHAVNAQLTTVGEAFWVGFMENYTEESSGNAVLIITANEQAQGTIDLSNFSPNWTVNFDLQAGESYTLRVSTYQRDLMHRTSGVLEKKGIFISSVGKVSVYAFNERYRSADGTVVLPISALGKDYLVTSHFEIGPESENLLVKLNEKNESLLLVVGVMDNTKVEITPSVTTDDGRQANVPFILILNEGESMQLRARADLTGSRVRVLGDDINDCKNVAVFGGSKWVGVGQCGEANDHLFQQVYPISSWGTSFIHVPLKSRTSGELVKILASEDDTKVTINGEYHATLSAGQFSSIDFGQNEIAAIETSKPSNVSVFAKSQMCNEEGVDSYTYGDPFTISYSPNQQLLRDVTFEALDILSIEQNYVNVIVYSSEIDKTFLDGQRIGGSFQVVPGNPVFSYARLVITSGSHHLQNESGFIGYVYGFGYLESYGYSVGANLENLNFEVGSEYEFEVFGDKVACLDQEAVWSILPENPIFTYFQWDFGDGSAIEIGQNVYHTYEQPGVYTVSISAAVSQNSCDQQEDIVFEVEVLETLGEIAGAVVVCPFEEIEYELLNKSNIENFYWEAEGGEIISQERDKVRVRWKENNEKAELKLLPFTYEGCPGMPISLEVNISDEISPEQPTGQEEVCFDTNIHFEYSANNVLPERKFEWFISNGEIISGRYDTLVKVKWNVPGVVGEIWFSESNNGNCMGVSDVLEVSIREELKVDVQVNQGLCFDDQSANVNIEVLSGSGPYTFLWDHEPGLNTPTLNNLDEGVYKVIVIDANGCQKVIDDINISYPEILEAVVTEVSSTSCYGRADGMAYIDIRGGTEPYFIDHEEFTISSEGMILNNLSSDEHQFTITDANGCTYPITFEVKSPEPLEVGVDVIRRSCPGGKDGELFAIPSGGQEPFEYTWDFNEQTGASLYEVPKGYYTVTVIDQNGCISFGSAALDEMAPIVRMPNAFDLSKNSDQPYFEPVSNCPLNYKLIIYNRWGELIYAGGSAWDGKVSGKQALSNTYNYVLEYWYELNESTFRKTIMGTVQLIN
ncbi:PKD domain-containing protein [Echinicola sp. 20G]|uniref:PKD domain-containing protein n=1 Tax=Echinicola sp. 20G TaxID=2781961 RepID=UPI00191062DC|nr:PKD domain-containing protein [Echinicola sp. 20G]